MSANPLPYPPDRPQNERPGQITTVWADGNVTRQSPSGAVTARPSVPPIPHKSLDLATTRS